MPPLATSLIDQSGTKLIRDWIDTLGVASRIDRQSTTDLPEHYNLFPAYPNPFNPTTTIDYELPITNYVEINIFNLLGQKIETLVSQRQPAGKYYVQWNASGYASGIYYYQLRSGNRILTRKMILLR